MSEHYIYQELGQGALEPLQPTEKKLAAAVLFIGLALLGGLFVLSRHFPLGG